MHKTLLLCCIIVSSCGMKIKGLDEAKADIKVETDIPESIALEPNFEKAIKVCDNKYGVGTIEAEDCFQDFRNFYSPRLTIGLDSIVNYCLNRFTEESDIVECESDLLDILSGVSDE